MRANKDDGKVKGRYHNDYSPKYKKPYDIYDKAKEHMRKVKKNKQKED